MKEILQFLENHWFEILKVLVAVVTLLILIFKKKVKVEDFFTGYLLALPGFINEAEELGLSGEAKYLKVFSRSINYLMSVSGKSLEEVTALYAKRINDSIEDILSTPQKKGLKKIYEEKNVNQEAK